MHYRTVGRTDLCYQCQRYGCIKQHLKTKI
jgi:hypothetical protein